MGRIATVLKTAALAGAAAAAGGAAWYATADAQRRFDAASAAGAAVRLLDPEVAHVLGVKAARWGLYPKETRPDPPSLRVQLWGREFPNPIGLAAGFDKDAEAIEPLLGLGFGFIEVGSITPRPQPGNPKPRVFRIPELKATVNRYGFNSAGAGAAAAQLDRFWRRVEADPSRKPGILAVNLGKNKETEDAADDYARGVLALGRYADVLVVNVSSPNTPGLRALQGRKQLEHLMRFVKAARDRLEWGPPGAPPLLVKVAPDLDAAALKDVAAAAAAAGVDGIVVGNTTVARPPEVQPYAAAAEAGGLSGPPLMGPSTAILAEMYKATGGRLPLVGCGGVASGADAYAKIRAGASLVELYTALAYEGPALVPRVKAELAELLAADGFASVAEAVGADHRPPNARRR